MKLYAVDSFGVPVTDTDGGCACIVVPDVNYRFYNWEGLQGVPAYLAARVLLANFRRVGHFGAGASYLERVAAMFLRHPNATVEIH